MSVATRNVSKTVPIDPLWEFDAPKIFDFVKMTDDDGIDSWFDNKRLSTKGLFEQPRKRASELITPRNLETRQIPEKQTNLALANLSKRNKTNPKSSAEDKLPVKRPNPQTKTKPVPPKPSAVQQFPKKSKPNPPVVAPQQPKKTVPRGFNFQTDSRSNLRRQKMESTEDRIVKEIETHRKVKEQVKSIKSKISKTSAKPQGPSKAAPEKKQAPKPQVRAPLQPRPVNITQYEKRKPIVKKLLDPNANEIQKPKRNFEKEKEIRERMLHGPPVGVPFVPPSKLTIPKSPALRTRDRTKIHQCLHANCGHDHHDENMVASSLKETAEVTLKGNKYPKTTQPRKQKSVWDGTLSQSQLAQTVTVPSSPKLRTKQRGLVKASLRDL